MARKPEARTKLLDAAIDVIRAKGYAATTVDDLCAAAGVTKGAFFHHFKTKDDLAVAAAAHWTEVTNGLFNAAPYRKPEDPLARLLAYLDFRRAMLTGEVAEFTCLLGTMVQETYDTSPAIREACVKALQVHIADVAADIAAARALYAPDAPWHADSLSRHIQTVLQGAFILAKAEGGPAPARDSLDHLIRYVRCLFGLDQAPLN